MTHILTIPGNPPITANQSRAWTWPKVRKHIAAIRTQAAWIARQQRLLSTEFTRRDIVGETVSNIVVPWRIVVLDRFGHVHREGALY